MQITQQPLTPKKNERRLWILKILEVFDLNQMLRNKTSHRFLAIYWVKHLHSCCFPIHFKFKLFVSEKFQFEGASETIQHHPELITSLKRIILQPLLFRILWKCWYKPCGRMASEDSGAESPSHVELHNRLKSFLS